MWPNKLLLSLMLTALLSAHSVKAYGLSGGMLLGYANNQVAVSGNNLAESPMGMNFFIDYALNSYQRLGAEHMRSLNLSPVSTAISHTGLVGRYYFYHPMPAAPKTDADAEGPSVRVKTISPYAAASVGVSQSSLTANSGATTAFAVGGYLSPKIGFDYQVFNSFFLRQETSYSITLFGTGQIQSLSILFGCYYLL